MTKVKICGLTNEADARFALRCGADYLGFIFHRPSPRSVSVETVTAMIRALRIDDVTGPLLTSLTPPLLVGVFVNETSQMIAQILSACGLDLAQLSGEEDSELASSEASPIFGRSYKALRPRTVDEARLAAPTYTAPTPYNAPTLLLDAYHPTLRGGTGETADWHLAAELGHITPRLMLAGGLTPANVSEAVRQVRPFAVDVASGVEAGPGQKDLEKVRQFIEAVRMAVL